MKDVLQHYVKAHPWHGLPSHAPNRKDAFYAYIELTPTDGVKYEVDKASGHLKVDRPQKFSNLCPTLYGFIPRTYCGDAVGAYCSKRAQREGIAGDGDPIDICVLTEKPIEKSDILVVCHPIGGLRLIDKGQADDKIVAVLEGDLTYGAWKSVREVPEPLVDRLQHYFLTYKQAPGETPPPTEITHVYDRDEAVEVISASIEDYRAKFGHYDEELQRLLNVSRNDRVV
ncbi:MAG: inorganic pyrophosphatase [Armatimonadetes bacterium]|nr:inorganic pyrophosphatase [Armatimonadota bacterium]